jgi:putative ABC transport system ATP-binding protein
MGSDLMVSVDGVHRTYRTGSHEVHALRGVHLDVPRGTVAAVVGRSGSGKTTLLNCVSGLDRPDAGTVRIDGQDVTAMGEDDRIELRRTTVGFVFQSFGLIPILSARENVGIPLRLTRTSVKEREQRVSELLELVGLDDHANHRPSELSGGQQQRVAVARALAARPSLLLADEPTGQLDSITARSVMRLMRSLVDTQGVTVVVATHDPVLIDMADEVHRLHDGSFS